MGSFDRRAHGAAYYEANKERIKARQRAYRAAHPRPRDDRDRASGRAYYWRHRDEINARRHTDVRTRAVLDLARRAWLERQPAQRLRLLKQVQNANTVARTLGLTGRLRMRDVEHLPQACVYCGSTENLTLDHALSMARGGENHWSNLTTACFSCNRQKWTRTPSEFLEARRVA